ncbi:MAG: hypothetical protein ABIM99_01720 [Candidatus Dojkabacteria bacterium]
MPIEQDITPDQQEVIDRTNRILETYNVDASDISMNTIDVGLASVYTVDEVGLEHEVEDGLTIRQILEIIIKGDFRKSTAKAFLDSLEKELLGSTADKDDDKLDYEEDPANVIYTTIEEENELGEWEKYKGLPAHLGVMSIIPLDQMTDYEQTLRENFNLELSDESNIAEDLEHAVTNAFEWKKSNQLNNEWIEYLDGMFSRIAQLSNYRVE